MSDQVKITYYGLYKEANRLLDKSKISLGEYERMIEPLNDEVREVGKWTNLLMNDGWTCSVCGYDSPSRLYNYCPNCGAKMERNE